MNRPRKGFGLILATASRAGALFTTTFGGGRDCGGGGCLAIGCEEGGR
jgi:hypothetical protein